MRLLLRLRGSLVFVTLAALGASALTALGACDKKATGAPAPLGPNADGSVPITVGKDGFQPKSVTFKKGAPGTLIFTRTTDETCATEVVFPQLDIKKDLPKDKPVAITVPTDKAQTLTFQCGMGMYKSAVVVAPN
jgi:plastocyanin domain-containing protein